MAILMRFSQFLGLGPKHVLAPEHKASKEAFSLFMTALHTSRGKPLTKHLTKEGDMFFDAGRFADGKLVLTSILRYADT